MTVAARKLEPPTDGNTAGWRPGRYVRVHTAASMWDGWTGMVVAVTANAVQLVFPPEAPRWSGYKNEPLWFANAEVTGDGVRPFHPVRFHSQAGRGSEETA